MQTKVKVQKVDKNTISISFPPGTKCIIREQVDMELLLQFLAPGGEEAFRRIRFQPAGPPSITLFSEENPSPQDKVQPGSKVHP